MNVDLGLLVLRLAVGGVVLAHGLLKVGWPVAMMGRGMAAVRATSGFFASLGFRPPMFWTAVTLAAEIGGTILMILGLGGPIGPGLVFGDMVIVTLVAHWPAGFWAGGGKQTAGVEFTIPLVAGALGVALIGNGGWSLDAALGLTYPDWLTPAWLVLMIAGDAALLAIRATRPAPAATPSDAG
jgi:putative oxidoreductase